MPTKRQAVNQLIHELELWAASKDILDMKTIVLIRHEHKISNDMVIAGIERWVLPPFKAGQLDDYLKSEISKAKLFSGKLLSLYDKTRPEMMKKMVNVKEKIAVISDEDRAHLLSQMTKVCKILLM